MDTTLETKFNKIGARVRTTTHRGMVQPIRIDIRRDLNGAYFDVRHRGDVRIHVPEVRPRDRHLVLTAYQPQQQTRRESTSTFLCGHDEQDWFVAAVPEAAQVRTVQHAKDALMPQEAWDSIREHRLPLHQRDARCTIAFTRQGEWFFLPRPWLQVSEDQILHDEPIRRGVGKPHECQFLFRTQRGNDELTYARGAVRHADHNTIVLPYWHQVVQNTETTSRAIEQVAYVD